jgi:Spy/CpxP family protein refolding chaperone
MTRKIVIALALAVGCAQKSSERPLPGDSVSEDGAVTLSPPRLSTPTTSASEGTGPIEARLYPPELAMEHQQELGITDEQRKALIAETERGNSEVLRLQWELESEKEKLVKLLEPDHVDEAKLKEAAARVTEREGKVKLAYLTMLVRVKNVLTPEQKQKLRARRAEAHKPPRGPVDGGTKD